MSPDPAYHSQWHFNTEPKGIGLCSQLDWSICITYCIFCNRPYRTPKTNSKTWLWSDL